MHQKGWTHSNKETYLGGVSATQEYTSFGGGGGDDQTQTFLPFPPPQPAQRVDSRASRHGNTYPLRTFAA